MGKETNIEWCDSTLNLQMGCDGCELWNEATGVKRCYAGILTERYGGKSKGYPARFTEPDLFPARLKEALRWPDLTGQERADKPWLNGYPRLVFLNDMGDTFTESLPLMWLAEHIPALAASRHIYILLTKRPQRMLEFWSFWCYNAGELPIPPNFWLLTSVTSAANVGRIGPLLKLRGLDASVLGVSYEPTWGPLDFFELVKAKLDWIIAGGESGPKAPPANPRWFRGVLNACGPHTIDGRSVLTPFFFKQWGEWMPWNITREFSVLTPFQMFDDGQYMARVGKKAAGRLLDGREWSGMPVLHAAYTNGKWLLREKQLDTNRTPGEWK